MDLPDLLEPFKRAVAPLGKFDELFPDATDTEIEGLLLDAFSDAQLDGFFSTVTSTDGGVVTPTLSRPQGALVILYAAKRGIEQEIRNRRTHVRYEAPGVVFEEDQAATILVELLKQAERRIKEVKAAAENAGYADAFVMVDQFFIRATSDYIADDEYGRIYDHISPWGH